MRIGDFLTHRLLIWQNAGLEYAIPVWWVALVAVFLAVALVWWGVSAIRRRLAPAHAARAAGGGVHRG